jgi:hypothetical protein
MHSFTTDQKIAMLVVPMLLFGMLGVSYASAAGRNLSPDEESTLRRAHAFHVVGDTARREPERLRAAIESNDYELFVTVLEDTPFRESATRPVFDTLVAMYGLHTNGDHDAADAYLKQVLYGS